MIYNATFNPICALTGVNTGGVLLTNSIIRDLLIPAMEEILLVSKARGVYLRDSIIVETIESIDVEAKIAPSMQKDIEKVWRRVPSDDKASG